MCKKDCDSDVIVVVLFMFYVWEEEQQKMVNRKCVMVNLDKMFVKCSPDVCQMFAKCSTEKEIRV